MSCFTALLGKVSPLDVVKVDSGLSLLRVLALSSIER